MRHLIALAGFMICCHQVHADPVHPASQRKPIDYSRSHALSGNSADAPAARSALDDLLNSRGTSGAGIHKGSSSELMNDEVAAWLASQNLDTKPPAAEAGTPSMAGSATRLADRFATLVVDAISHIGVPYKYGGNSVESGGFDCSGFVRAVYHEALGAILPRRSEEQAAATEKINRDELRPGDLVFFNTTRRAFSHVGIYVGEDKFVHAPRTGARVRIESLTSSYWLKRFNGARRVQVEDAVPVAQFQAAGSLPAY